LAESFSWLDGERLIRFGEGALAEAPALLAGRGFEDYALLTTERAQSDAPELADRAVRVAQVPSGPVPDAAGAVRDEVRGMPLVALGGGRVIDSAKAIAGADGAAVAAVPTTLSGAPMTRFHRMPAGVEQFNLVRPALVIAAPELMASQPMPDLAASAMNACAHAVESLYGPMRSPVTSMAAHRAVELFESGLGGDEPRRDDLALASILGGYSVGCTGFAVHHAVCQTTVRVLGTPHAQTNAVMLPHSAAFVDAREPGALEGVEPAILARLAARAGVTTLGELGVTEDQLDPVIEGVLAHPAIGNTPGGTPTADELRELLSSAL
jgi:alcohol dehydrogenase class IV